jgi:hypothetical protein
MASDMVVALPRATVDGHAFFGHNSNQPASEYPSLVRESGRDHAPGEAVWIREVCVPQARHTLSVLGGRTGTDWGYQHGVNEKGVTLGCSPIRTRLVNEGPCLTGPDLVRLALERATSALQAVEVLTDLINRHGQGAFANAGQTNPDSAFLVADVSESYVIEASGRHWALANVGSVRAVTDTCFLHQDWDRISRGLSDLAIQRGWWPEDGCKLDFAEAVGQKGVDLTRTLRRWGWATMELEQHSGNIDGAFLRRLLREQSEAVILENPARDIETMGSLIVRLGLLPESLPLAWYAFGPPQASVYLPILPIGDLPAPYTDQGGRGSPLWRVLRGWIHDNLDDRKARAGLIELQEQLDDLTWEFHPEADALHRRGEAEPLRRLATSFMQHAYERFEELAGSLGTTPAELGSPEREIELMVPGPASM